MAEDQRRDRRFAVRVALAFGRAVPRFIRLAAGLSVTGLAASGLAPSGLAASGFAVSVLGVSGLAVSALVSVLASSLSAPCRLRLFSLSDLKSVSYQPEPLRRNTGADISLRRPFLPQLGHLVSGLSVIFCSTSSS